MRKALLVVTLVAASFAGGAAVNGPGLKWVKALITSRLNPAPAIPTVEVDAEPPGVSSNGASPVAATTAAEPEPSPVDPLDDIPSTPAPSLVSDLIASTPTPATPSILTPAPDSEVSPAPSLVAEPPAEAAQPDLAVAQEAAPPKPEAQPGGWSDAPGPAPAIAVLPQPKIEPGPTSDHAVAAASGAPATPAMTAAGAGALPPSGWAAIRKRMKAMGVKKYWVEGTPAGAVTFRCVVPVPGQDAVSQQFEAEGDDDLQAAEIALRRASLWQASQRLK